MPKLLQTEVKSCMTCCGLELGYYIGIWYVCYQKLTLFYPKMLHIKVLIAYIPILGILKSQGEFYSLISQIPGPWPEKPPSNTVITDPKRDQLTGEICSDKAAVGMSISMRN
jgi:hypothetical protein